MKKILIISVLISVVISVVIFFVTPPAYSQIENMHGLYEGFSIEYETTVSIVATDPKLEEVIEQMDQELVGALQDFDNLRIDVLEVTNQGATLEFSVNVGTELGYVPLYTKFFTFSELTEPPFPWIVSTDSAKGEHFLKIDYPGIPVLESENGTSTQSVNDITRETIVFNGERTFTEDGIHATERLTLTYDVKTGFLAGVMFSVEVEDLGSVVNEARFVDIGKSIPKPTPKPESEVTQPTPESEPEAPVTIVDDNGGGCLIATATFGSELAPQVQQLREIRDNSLLQTESGRSFMKSFNQFYYSFSPEIADLERENPVFKEAMKLIITPLLSSLSLLNYVDMDSEVEVLGYGISLILLNIGMYFVLPAFVIHRVRKYV